MAAALLEKETIDGAEVGRLVDEAYGRPVHEDARVVPQFAPDPEDDRGRPPTAGDGAPLLPGSLPLPTTPRRQGN